MTSKVSKESVDFRYQNGDKRCGNCAIFNAVDGSCDLVRGFTLTQMVCNEWRARGSGGG